MPDTPAHFQGKDALNHVIDAQSRGFIASSESHGIEMPGYLSAAADALRETALFILLLWTLPHSTSALTLTILLFGWIIWKAGRAGWLGSQRLERLNRLMQEESYEIQHHRAQERSELKELYQAKGFQGKLLEDVLDVLMADDDRLLKVMIEEEMGLQLEQLDHPFQQALGAGAGVFIAAAICALGWWAPVSFGIPVATIITISAGAAFSAAIEKNKIIPAIVWNASLGGLAYGCVYFLFQYFTK